MVCITTLDYTDCVAIDRGVGQLSAFTLDEIRRGIEDNDYRERAPDFRPTFVGLADSVVKDELKEAEKRERVEKQMTQATLVLVPSTPSLTLLDGPRTPGQPTHPEDPKNSGSSTESKIEGTPNTFILEFLRDCSFCLGGSFRQLLWPRTQNIVRLAVS